MKGHAKTYAVGKMCKAFKVCRSGYYKWLGRTPSRRDRENAALRAGIREVYEESGQVYGSPRIREALKAKGVTVSRARVARHMGDMGIRSILGKGYRPCTTMSGHGLPVADNILDRGFSAHAPGEKWVSDITYIPVAGEWVYLTVIIDLFDRKVVGWAVSEGMTVGETTARAWQMAITNRKPKEGFIFHSDRGIQYAAKGFRALLEKQKAVQSMSRKGNCWDNAVAESFFKTIKKERLDREQFRIFEQAKLGIFEAIEIWYNRKRLHQTLGYRTPEQTELQYLENVA